MEERVRPSRANVKARSITLGILKVVGRILFFCFTLALIGVCTTAIFAKIFLTYVDTTLRPTLAANLEDYTMDQTSIIYYHDNTVEENGGWVEDQRLHGEQNRIVVPYSEIPKAMAQATVAIEDERFYEHQGVDWKRTAGAVVNTLTGSRAVFGGSTITQQVLKNITGEDDPYISRKVKEIFRALDFEKDHTKDEIMEL
ncbi:MAG: transglycosylase domain-containing protein [Oscillibacter sp.]|nr:transglycosylase domain-containing protein [Oscillibacter sp.]